MLFNSIVFLIFAVVFFAGWPLVRRTRNPRFLYLVVASFIFYGWWDWRFLFLIMASGLLDYFCGLGMRAMPGRKRVFLVLSVLGNVGSLLVFKYSGFFADNLSFLLGLCGLDVNLKASLPHFVLILPVGISFYTFQSMSYTIDVYKGNLQPTRNVLHFFAYLSLFPQLVAGPIIRAADLLPQLNEIRSTSEAQRWEGLRLICYGFFKKVVIADSLAYFVSGAFDGSFASDGCLFWWVIISAFAIQIYCDFSGYSDIARGLACWMGYSFMVNFDHPFVATSVREFWARWHISLSTWFRDYLYVPLGGSRTNRFRAEVNMWITMVVSGFWHGAAWTYVVWGAMHAAGMSLERFTCWPQVLGRLPRVGRTVAWVVFTIQLHVTWVFFRSESLTQAVHITKCMFSLQGGLKDAATVLSGANVLNIFLLVAVMFVRQAYFFFHLDQRRFLPEPVRRQVETVALAALIVACVFFRGPGSQFIYFQF